MTSAAITPGTQPHKVNSVVIIIDPQPLSIIARGGKITASMTLSMLIVVHLVIPITAILCTLVSAYRRVESDFRRDACFEMD